MVCPNEGKVKILDEVFRLTSTREAFKLDLFVNNETVDALSTAGDFTIASFTGYSQISIARADWDPAVDVGTLGEISKTTAPTFTCTGGSPQTAYGWILRGATSGLIYFGQNFDTPRVMGPGTTESIDPFTVTNDTYDV